MSIITFDPTFEGDKEILSASVSTGNASSFVTLVSGVADKQIRVHNLVIATRNSCDMLISGATDGSINLLLKGGESFTLHFGDYPLILDVNTPLRFKSTISSEEYYVFVNYTLK